MRGAIVRRFWKSDAGAVAPTVTLSLFALIAAGGIAFDYARLAAMDTELQNAADQAALAAASQLDGKTGAQTRAIGAAQTLISNQTLFANDGGGRGVTVPTIVFFQSYNADTDTPGPAATGDGDARVVQVTVGAREAFYALTPIVGAIRSGNIAASATASLGTSICRTPPVMLCNPFESVATGAGFDAAALRGVGLRLLTGSAVTPGNFGFLQTGFGSGASNLAQALGYDVPPGDCVEFTGVTTEPGQKQSVFDALSTRFDMDPNGNQTCPFGDANCSAPVNARKDLVKGNQCNLQNNGFSESPRPYRPNSAAYLDASAPLNTLPDVMGFPRDVCHAWSFNGNCPNGIIGNGDWDRDLYFRVNHGYAPGAWVGAGATGLPANATRYDVYKWEEGNVSRRADQNVAGGKKAVSDGGVCRPDVQSSPDRRRISVAVVNCEAQNLTGRETGVQVLSWVDVFLVEPPFNRYKKIQGNGNNIQNGDQVTSDDQVYVEVIGPTDIAGGGGNTGQVIRRDVPYLIR